MSDAPVTPITQEFTRVQGLCVRTGVKDQILAGTGAETSISTSSYFTPFLASSQLPLFHHLPIV